MDEVIHEENTTHCLRTQFWNICLDLNFLEVFDRYKFIFKIVINKFWILGQQNQ